MPLNQKTPPGQHIVKVERMNRYGRAVKLYDLKPSKGQRFITLTDPKNAMEWLKSGYAVRFNCCPTTGRAAVFMPVAS